MFCTSSRCCGWLAGGLLTALAGGVQAAGFELPQRGIKEMGTAYAGSAALLEDASAIANNPAGLMRLQGRHVSGGLTLIKSGFDYDVTVQRELIDGVGGVVPGRSQGSIGALSAVPHAYYSRRLSDNAAMGIGLYVPNGSTTEYGNRWAGRYHASDTAIQTVNFAPTFAWRETDRLSFGLGVVLQSFSGEFKNSIDVGYLVADQVITEVEETSVIGIDVTLRDGADGVVDDFAHNFDVDNFMTVNSWGYGFNFGALWEHSEQTRVGLHYASAVHHLATGEARRPQTLDPAFQQSLEDAIRAVRLSVLGIPAGTIGSQRPESAIEGAAKAVGPLGAQGGDIELDLVMPETVTLSAVHQWRPALALMASLTWTNWSRIDELRFVYTDRSERGGAPIVDGEEDVGRRDLVQPFDWQDAWRASVGAHYQFSDRLQLRTGLAWDQSPVPSAARRTPRGPDSDRIILGVGGGWVFGRMSVDLAWTLTRFVASEINSRENPAGTQHRMSGDYQGLLHSLGGQVNWRF